MTISYTVIFCIDILPAFETKDKKTVTNPIEAYIVAEVRNKVISLEIDCNFLFSGSCTIFCKAGMRMILYP